MTFGSGLLCTCWFQEDSSSETGYSESGWITLDALEDIDPNAELLDNYSVAYEYVNPLGTIFQFLTKKGN